MGVDNRFSKNEEENGRRLIKGDIEDLSMFKDGEFGFVWMSEVLEHLDNPAQTIAEAKRVGKHGACLFSTPQNSNFKLDPDHKIVTGVDYLTLDNGDGLCVW